MATNRLPPAESLPAPSSASEEEEEENEKVEEEESSEEESSEEEQNGEENKWTASSSPPPPPPPAEDKKASSSNKLVAPTPVKSNPQTSSEDEEDGSESESESDSEADSPPKHRRSSSGAEPTTINPITTKAGVSVTKPTHVKPSKNSKRQSEIRVEKKELKRAKKEEAEADDGMQTGDDSKKPMLFQRIWSEEDEIITLKGMIDFSAKHGCVPYPNGDMNEFYCFVKNSLHGNFSKAQLTDKTRRLKKKYSNNVARAQLGKDPTFQKPHDQKAFELSKKIWGTGEGNRTKGKEIVLLKLENEPKTEPADPPTKHSLVVSDFTRINESVCLSSSLDRAIERGLGLLSDSAKSELNEKRKELEDGEFQLYMKKIELIQMQTTLAMQAYRANHY